MKKNILVIIPLLSFLTLSCDKDEPENVVVLPTNIITAVITDMGKVDVSVAAENANFYSVTFIEGTDSTIIETKDGNVSYTYTQNGAHQIISKAHTSQYEFIEKIDNVTITTSGFTNTPPTGGYETPIAQPGYTLVWSDEFNGSDISSSWTFDIGTGNSGWGNNELQNYTNSNYIVTNGYLEIFAKETGSQNYSSTRIKTEGLESWQYGRVDIRAALPFGQGIWPALWMLGDNITSAGWPSCGEIDIMELVGGDGANDRTVHGTAHWDSNGYASYGNSKSLPGGKFADEFHVFSIIWDANSITWLLDDVQYNVLSISGSDMSEFHQNFFFIFNIAVGGNWPGSPNSSTVFPQSMFVDYVRIFQ
ncbi:MAG: family 16 glycosylhydrolase [Crocinitomicaceae bacterium]